MERVLILSFFYPKDQLTFPKLALTQFWTLLFKFCGGQLSSRLCWLPHADRSLVTLRGLVSAPSVASQNTGTADVQTAPAIPPTTKTTESKASGIKLSQEVFQWSDIFENQLRCENCTKRADQVRRCQCEKDTGRHLTCSLPNLVLTTLSQSRSRATGFKEFKKASASLQISLLTVTNKGKGGCLGLKDKMIKQRQFW